METKKKENYFLETESAEVIRRVLTAEDIKNISAETGLQESVVNLITKGKKKTSQDVLQTIVDTARDRVAKIDDILK